MKTKKPNKEPAVKKTNMGGIFINVSAILLFGETFIWMFISVFNQERNEAKMEDNYSSTLPALEDTIPHNKVCMVDDVYQGDFKTLPIALVDKTYYGCSAKATKDLAKDEKLRIAEDPINKRKVDKAIAIIAIHPDKDGKVIYFESKETRNKYLNAIKAQKNEKK